MQASLIILILQFKKNNFREKQVRFSAMFYVFYSSNVIRSSDVLRAGKYDLYMFITDIDRELFVFFLCEQSAMLLTLTVLTDFLQCPRHRFPVKTHSRSRLPGDQRCAPRLNSPGAVVLALQSLPLRQLRHLMQATQPHDGNSSGRPPTVISSCA